MLLGTLLLTGYASYAASIPSPVATAPLPSQTLPRPLPPHETATTISLLPYTDDEIKILTVSKDTDTISTTGQTPREKKSSRVTMYTVPFYSQFKDIAEPKWQKVACGIASVAMIIDHYTEKAVEPNTLLEQGIAAGAYLSDAGWTHQGLINLAKSYNLDGESHSYASDSMAHAWEKLTTALKQGPVMASVHYTFDPQNPIPHLVVVTGVKDDTVYYNDPAETTGGGTISLAKFQKAWKKRYIEIRPTS